MDAVKFSKLTGDYLRPAKQSPLVQQVLLSAVSPETTAHDMGVIVSENQAYLHFFQKLDILQVRITEWLTEPEAPGQKRDLIILERIVNLLGKHAVRNVVACLSMNRLAGTLPKKPNDVLTVSLKNQLKFALATEGFCQDHALAHTGWAFVGGYHYDVLKVILTKRKAPADVANSLDSVWSQGLKVAQIAYDLGRLLKNFSHDQRIFSAALVLPIGKILMSVLFPKELGAGSWNAFVTEAGKLKGSTQSVFLSSERRRFQTSQAEVSALYLSFFGLLSPIEKAVFFSQEPYYLKNIDRDLFKLSVLLSISQSIASATFEAGKEPYLPLSSIQKKWLGEIKISEVDVMSIVREVARKGQKK